MFKDMKLGVKLGLGFSMVALILVVAVLTSIWQVGKTSTVTNRVMTLRAPTSQSSLAMLNGINHSLAALRGWIILSKDKFKKERAKAWNDEINPSLKTMKTFAVNWTNPKNVERLRIIEENLKKFNQFQIEIEDIAQTVDNTPALKILFVQAAPQASILIGNITKMIDAELKVSMQDSWNTYQGDVARRQELLLRIKADFGYGGLIHKFKNYVLRGKPKYLESIRALHLSITETIGEYSSVNGLTAEEKSALAVVQETANKYMSAADHVSTLLTGEDTMVSDLDKAVKIDDSPAIAGFEVLNSRYEALVSEKGKHMTGAVKRKEILGMMADVRGTTGLGLANIRAYLLSGDEKFRKLFEKFWAKNTTRFADLKKNVHLLTDEQKNAFKEFSDARKKFNPLPPKMFKIRGSLEWNLANRWLGTKAAPTAFKIKTQLDAMQANQVQLMATDIKEADRLTGVLNKLEWALLFAGIVLSAVIGFFITRGITKPINRIIAELTEGSSQVSAASSQISSSSQSLASGASQQAASLEETSSSLEQMTSMADQNAKNTREAASLANGATKTAEKGLEAMQRMTESIDSIKKSSDETARIIKTIDEIAFQTNLLALNAAVEAARAGEAGKGFAVVAEEVRNLAQRSAEAARTTSQMIEESQNNADSGVKVSEEVAVSLNEINENVKKVTSLVNQVASSTDEQARGVSEMNQAVTQMDSITQQNAASAEESASASEELNAQAGQLDSVVDDLAQVVGGRSINGSNGNGSRPHLSQDTTDVMPKKQHELHEPAHQAPPKKQLKELQEAKTVKADEVIPMDDGDFKDF